jgi:hypothetical protein
MSDYYGIDGRAITIDEWTSTRAGGEWERAKRSTKVNDETAVSTVWVGLDHSWGDGPPLIFESMIFGGNLDQEQVRYATLEQAHAGHEELVAKAKREAAAFAELAADQRVRDCLTVIEEALAEHRKAFDIDEYGSLYGALRTAVTP